MTKITAASIIQAERVAHSTPSAELERLRCEVEAATQGWSNPNVYAVGQVHTSIYEAAVLLIEELRTAGYAANFVLNEPSVVVFALNQDDAPSPSEDMA